MSAGYDESEYVFCDLREFPDLGRPRPEFGYEGLRSWRVCYLIFYRRIAGKVQIWRRLHGSRDLQRILAEGR
jgi:plasmid stabilization system protein ParE